jgi:hypothetical protein
VGTPITVGVTRVSDWPAISGAAGAIFPPMRYRLRSSKFYGELAGESQAATGGPFVARPYFPDCSSVFRAIVGNALRVTSIAQEPLTLEMIGHTPSLFDERRNPS